MPPETTAIPVSDDLPAITAPNAIPRLLRPGRVKLVYVALTSPWTFGIQPTYKNFLTNSSALFPNIHAETEEKAVCIKCSTVQFSGFAPSIKALGWKVAGNTYRDSSSLLTVCIYLKQGWQKLLATMLLVL